MNRREFISSAAFVSVYPSIAKLSPAGNLANFGIQLYMMRAEMERDTRDTLQKLGQLGYTQIESYGGPKGIFWGMKNTEFVKLAEGYGLRLISSHYNDDIPFEQQAVQAAEAGMKYLICPWKGPQKSIDDFKRIAEEFNGHGEICRKHGLRFGYHPHDYPYKPVEGQLPIDVLLAGTDKSLVDFQMDFYYAITEGVNPEAYIKKHSGRFTSCHMRDVLKHRLPAGSKEESACDLGQGVVDYPKLLSVAKQNGMRCFFVEQSRYYHEMPLQSAAINAQYLKHIRLS